MKKFFNKFHIFLILIYLVLASISVILLYGYELINQDVFIFFNITIFIVLVGILLFEFITRQRKLRIQQLESKIRKNASINKRKL
ncbi:MAG TPA: hypothetical protein VJ878_00230, partial [Candidatus Izemoplasmatales bacterium]|nr:hypothetical protein [Candidatus Izemoplasmatales bacterium]